MPTASLTIVNRLGLHARAAAKLVGCAKGFASAVILRHEEQEVDGKSIMNVMLLAAPLGSRIELSVSGEDEGAAFTALTALIECGFEEGVVDPAADSGDSDADD